MKKSIYVILILTGFITALQFCNNKLPAISEDPIAAIGHGSILDKEGKNIKLTETFIKQIQELYIRKLSDPKLSVREGGAFNEQKIKTIKDIIYNTVKNDVLANALYIEKLIELRKPADEARFSTATNALRWYYVLNIQKNSILPDKNNKWSKGLPDDEAQKLEENDIIVYAITNSGMEAYCNECLEAGVPVPANMFGSEWQNLGEIDNEFISQTGLVGELRAELMIYVSNDPEGFCLALPRIRVGGSNNEAELFGVICLGTRTSKACFFDNPNGTYFRKDEVIPFRSNFLGGTDLILNGQGTCSDCHAGENPYVVHPEKDPFKRILDDNLDGDVADGHVPSRLPPRWYDPIVPGTWPQNPGPTNILDAVTSTERCNSCHQPGIAGRFPDLSFPLPGYCVSVLSNAVRPIALGGTMPPGSPPPGLTPDQYRAQFAAHIEALTSYCNLTREDGKIETGNIPGDPSFISPPMIIGPLYACATKVAVKGAVLDAKVTLYINGSGVSVIDPARNPLQLEFSGLPALRAGDVVTAIQEIGGAVSDPSEAVTVRNYQEDYPGGLPKPAIDPVIIYACADVIAVRHVPGATVTIYKNGSNPTSWITSTGWSAIPLGGPCNESDEFTAQISLCSDVSPMSDPVRARRAPMILALPAFNPATIFNGQELLNIENIVHGAKVTLRETGSGWSGSFSTPITWFPNYDIKTAMSRPLQTGDDLQSMQSLCSANSDWSLTEKPYDCERLPAPQIERPVAGNRFVIVSRAVPGARVMVYDASTREIGDGSGTVVWLSRAVIAGETLSVTQRVGECTSNFIYRVRAGGGQ